MTIIYTRVFVTLGVVLMLAGCSKPPKDDMQVPLDKIRDMVVQSALITVQAACSEPSARAQLVDGALALLRRATAGPEMMRIHQMMGEMTMDRPGDIPGNSKDQPDSPQQAMHIAVHAAGGDGFNLLDAMTRPGGAGEPGGLGGTAARASRGGDDARCLQDPGQGGGCGGG